MLYLSIYRTVLMKIYWFRFFSLVAQSIIARKTEQEKIDKSGRILILIIYRAYREQASFQMFHGIMYIFNKLSDRWQLFTGSKSHRIHSISFGSNQAKKLEMIALPYHIIAPDQLKAYWELKKKAEKFRLPVIGSVVPVVPLNSANHLLLICWLGRRRGRKCSKFFKSWKFFINKTSLMKRRFYRILLCGIPFSEFLKLHVFVNGGCNFLVSYFFTIRVEPNVVGFLTFGIFIWSLHYMKVNGSL